MQDENIIDLICQEVDQRSEWQEATTLSDVVRIFRELEAFVDSQDLSLEHEVPDEEFVDVDAPEDEEDIREEVVFILPILQTNLHLEFRYWKAEDTTYRIWVDVDFYSDDEDADYD